MIQRFHIDELVTQDAFGVVFRAVDRETGLEVALRRFFPFGAAGGGLEDDERSAYTAAIRRLTELRHPGMRTVIAGDCDPIDGIPFIATEWLEGEILAEALALDSPLEAAPAAELLARALEICELLSAVFADERVWIDTAPGTIIREHAAGARGFTFWLAPLRWLGTSAADSPGLATVLELAEEVLGWRGRMIADHAAGGLGSWVNWLRTHHPHATLAEARQNLAAALGKQVPVPAELLVEQAIASAPPLKLPQPSTGRLPVILSAAAALLVAGAGWWLFQRTSAPETPAPAAVAAVSSSSGAATGTRQSPEAARASALATRIAAETSAAQEKQSAERAAMLAAISARGGAYGPGDGALLLEMAGSVVIIEAVLVRTRLSDSGATFYFEFSENTSPSEPRGYLLTKTAGPEVTEAAFRPFIGKTVRITGRVRIFTSGGARRPEILVANPASIELVK